MRNLFRAFIITSLFLFISSCNNSSPTKALYEEGVSKSLAEYRKEHFKDVIYNLYFSIPEEREQIVKGCSEINFKIEKSCDIIIDFRAETSQIDSLLLNGDITEYVFENEHIILSEKQINKGENTITIYFSAADQSLNRRDDYLYTLLVPDRARTLFPCFDQPNIKALFNLSLEVPAKWQAVANGIIEDEELTTEVNSNADTPRHLIKFKQTEPLSTYLFSFVTGILNEEKFSKNGREISIYHRETDSKKIAQCNDIAQEVFHSLEWLEEYTAIPYPFAKYDLIILPGFQYGGMEHTGATLYNNNRMFLNEHPTINEQLSRSSLIAHETAHMWFGDFVTMNWFDDVWTKEVFANYFASMIVEPQYTEVNHRLNFITDYFPSAYSEDRTDGANPIKQNLDNLNNAGLVYGNIIYNKSPIVMEMLANQLGDENFKNGIREYLKTFAYSNATWDQLIDILDKYTSEDLKKWSYNWVNTPGMPEIDTTETTNIKVRYTTVDNAQKEVIIPNADGRAYGYLKIDKDHQNQLWNILLEISNNNTLGYNLPNLNNNELEVLRGSLLIMLYENLRRNDLNPECYISKMMEYIQKENNPLLYSLAIGYIGNCAHLHLKEGDPQNIELENTLWNIINTHPKSSFRIQAFRLYRSIASSETALDKLYTIWDKQNAPEKCHLSESDYINLSYILALNFPEKAEHILNKQLQRISNPDRILEYKFISPSVSPQKSVRDSVFNALLQAHNRRIEPWASSALSYLNHPLRGEEALEYIRPALEKMKEVQKTGDIFFPRSWAKALLSGHTSSKAGEIVDQFFTDNPEYPYMLGLKIKQQAWHLR